MASTAHLPTSARLRAQAPGPVSGQLYKASGGGAGHAAMLCCCLSATGIRFLGILSRPGIAPPLRSAYHAASAARTRTGFPCSARVRPGWLRVPSLPRGRRCPHGRSFSPAAACRIATASPYHPGPQPAPGRISDEASARVHCHSPHTSLPLACDPGRNGILGLSPELRTPPGKTRRRTSGRGQARTLPGLRRWHQPASFRRTHSQRATSRRTHDLICAPHSMVANKPSPTHIGSGAAREPAFS